MEIYVKITSNNEFPVDYDLYLLFLKIEIKI